MMYVCVCVHALQEDVLGEVTKAESDAGSYLEQMSRYRITDITIGLSVFRGLYLDAPITI